MTLKLGGRHLVASAASIMEQAELIFRSVRDPIRRLTIHQEQAIRTAIGLLILVWKLERGMIEERIHEEIDKMLARFRYRSALLEAAIVLEGGEWKIFVLKVVLDVKEHEQAVHKLIEKDKLVFLRAFLPIEKFVEFLDMLKRVYVGNLERDEKTGAWLLRSEKDKLVIDGYRISMVGNFPQEALSFQGSKVAEEIHGIAHPCFYASYSIASGKPPKSLRDVDLETEKPPFSDAWDAVTYHFNVRLDVTINEWVCLFFPIYLARIKSCSVEEDSIVVSVEYDPTLVKLAELDLSVICKERTRSFRDKVRLVGPEIKMGVGFKADSVRVTLLKGDQVLDRYERRPISGLPREVPTGTGKAFIERALLSLNWKDAWRELSRAEKAYEEGRMADCCNNLRMGFITFLIKACERLEGKSIPMQPGKAADIGVLKESLKQHGAPEDVVGLIGRVWSLTSERAHVEKKGGKVPSEAEVLYCLQLTYATVEYLLRNIEAQLGIRIEQDSSL